MRGEICHLFIPSKLQGGVKSICLTSVTGAWHRLWSSPVVQIRNLPGSGKSDPWKKYWLQN